MSTRHPRGPYPGIRGKSKMVWTKSFDFCVLPTTVSSANDDIVPLQPPSSRRKGSARRN